MKRAAPKTTHPVVTLPVSKPGYPWVHVEHPDYKWTVQADAQAKWRKYGWMAPSEYRKRDINGFFV